MIDQTLLITASALFTAFLLFFFFTSINTERLVQCANILYICLLEYKTTYNDHKIKRPLENHDLISIAMYVVRFEQDR